MPGVVFYRSCELIHTFHKSDDRGSGMMTRNVTFWVLVSAMVSLIFLQACSRGPSRINPPSINASAAGEAAIAEFDANKDGKIAGAEFDKVPSLKSNLKKLDTNNDQAVSADEITERIKFWQDVLKVGRQSIHCTILRNGLPLTNAEVKFVPEKFLGENMKVAKGTTGENGVCRLSIEMEGPDDVPGVPPGFYRVEVTKAGENIPPKYNTATTLGIDCATDNEEVARGLKFELKY
jgi:hypothetical protein